MCILRVSCNQPEGVWLKGWTKRILSLNTRDLCFDCWLLLLILEVKKPQITIVVEPHPVLPSPLPLAEVTSKGFKESVPFSSTPPLSFLLFFLLRARDERCGHSKATTYTGETRKSLQMTRKRGRLRFPDLSHHYSQIYTFQQKS